MKFPHFLPEQGTIGFIAPSFGCVMEPYNTSFHRALDIFHKKGFQTNLGPNCFADTGIGISNTPQKCGEEVNEYFAKGDIDVLISCGGGELMCEDLNYINFEEIAKLEPKWFMGYSDNTNLTFLLTTICDIASIYGPCASTFGMEPWHESLHDALDLLQGKKLSMKGYPSWELMQLRNKENPYEPYNTTEPAKLVHYPEVYAKMEGRLLGGCVDCLVTLLGTKFDQVNAFQERYKEDGIIWFLECCDFNTISMRRAFWQMDNAGWFQTAKGFIIGRPMHFGEDDFGLDQYEAVLGILRKYQVPVIMDADVGHLPPMMPLVNGAKAVVESKGNSMEVTMKME